MATDGNEPVESQNSLDTAITGAEDKLTDAGQKPDAAEPAKPDEPDIDSLLTQLEAVRDKIPAERLASLNPQMQAGFTRKMNLLQQTADRVEKGLGEMGMQLPEGKSVMDLLTEDDGKGFFEALGQVQQKNMAPVTEFVSAQRQAAQIAEMTGLAVQEFPIVKDHLDEARQIISQDGDLLKLAQTEGWRGLPYVLRGVATDLALRKLQAEHREMKKLLDASKVAGKTGTSTSRAGGIPSKESATRAKTLEAALDEGFRRAKEAQGLS
jgi:hypothetical protein